MPQEDRQKLYERKSVLAALPCTKRPYPIILGGDPNDKNFLYCNGKTVVMRNLACPKIADLYSEHNDIVTVAKYSPNGRLIASADIGGNLRIWDSLHASHPLEKHFQPINGIIKDLSWSPDSLRILVAGKGEESSGKLMQVKTGTTLYELGMPTKGHTSCDVRQTGSMRFCTGSDDSYVSFYEGPPFKYRFSKASHNNIVNSVRFSPDGRFLASAGFDGKVFLYDGRTCALIIQIGCPAHLGIVSGLCWSPDSKEILTCSEDGTCKIWDITTNTMLQKFIMGKNCVEKQVSCLWQGNYLLSVAMNGEISYLDRENPSVPIQVLYGTNQALTGLSVASSQNLILTYSEHGEINSWNYHTGEIVRIRGEGHEGAINDMALKEKMIYTCGNDLSLRQIALDTQSFTKYLVKLNMKPIGVGAMKDTDTMVVACQKKIFLINTRMIIFSMPINYHATCLSVNDQTKEIAIGGHDFKVHLYKTEKDILELGYELPHKNQINGVSFSPDSKSLAACDAGGKVRLYVKKNGRFTKHKSWHLKKDIVTAMAWCPNSSAVATASLEHSINIQTIHSPQQQIVIPNPHGQAIVTRLAWLDKKTLVSTGMDSNTILWDINFEQSSSKNH